MGPVDLLRFLGGAEVITGGQTAIARRGPSAPCRMFFEKGLVEAPILDYGAGRGADAIWLRQQGADVTAWDPFWGPTHLDRRRRYQTVLLTYVLNVLPADERKEALLQAWGMVKRGGRLLVTVRTDLRGKSRTQWRTVEWLEKELVGLTKINLWWKLLDHTPSRAMYVVKKERKER